MMARFRCGTMLVAVLLLALQIGVLPAQAQGADDFAALREQVDQLDRQGKYGDALVAAERHVALARERFGDQHPEYGAAVQRLAKAYHRLGRYPEAEPLYKRALAISEKAHGPDHLEVG